MPCPHLARDSGECVLLEETLADEDERGEFPVEESVDRELCLGAGEAYRSCPIFRRFIADLLP